MLIHLLELRRRALQTAFFFLGVFVICFTQSECLFSFLMKPLREHLPLETTLIATQITSPLITPIHLAASVAMLLCMPIVLFHIWRFISPGLYRHEQGPLRMLLVLSLGLFCLGVLFCYYLVLPWMMQFFISAVPKGVRLLPDMTYAVTFMMRMLLIFGVCFQVPLLCLVLVRFKLITVHALKRARPYVIVAAFIIGMLLTPPDVLSQIMLAVPICLLYEGGLLMASTFDKPMPEGL